MAESLDHAVLVTAAGSSTTSGQRLTGPVDSVVRLGQLLDWVCGRGGLMPLGGPGQVWVIGRAACEALGWWTQEEDRLPEVIAETAPVLGSAGWTLLGAPGAQTLLSKTVTIPGGRRERRLVQIVLEPFAPLITKRTELGLLENLPESDTDAAAELGRRIRWLVEHLGVLPVVTAAGTGARILDDIYRTRGKGAVVTEAGLIPGLEVDAGDGGAGAVGVGELEPAAHWGRPHIDANEISADTELVLLDQRGAYLATAGSIELGFGPLTHVVGAEHVSDILRADKAPFGVFRAVLPAGGRLSTPPQLPLPHPLMHPDRDVTAWITTESVRGLCAPVADGGAGLSIEDLGIDEAWVWESSRRFLQDWAARLRTARLAAIGADDQVLKTYIGAIYKQYVGRMGSDKWSASKMHHYQPVWRAAIIAHCRWRARRQAMAIYASHGLWPIYTFTDSWRYLTDPGTELAPTETGIWQREAAGESVPLGRLVEQHRRPLDAEQRAALLASTSGQETAAIIYRDGGIPTQALQPTPTPPPEPQPAPTTPAPPATQMGEQPTADEKVGPRRRAKGSRERTYVGDSLADIHAPVSPKSVADLITLVDTGQFSYLPDGINHTSTTNIGEATDQQPAAAVDTGLRGFTGVPVAAIVAVVLAIIAVVAVIVVLAVI